MLEEDLDTRGPSPDEELMLSRWRTAPGQERQLPCSVIRHREVDLAEIPMADRSWIDAAAERFKRVRKNGERPRIEEFRKSLCFALTCN
jgi:hypothetical protein